MLVLMMSMHSGIINLSGYRFVRLEELPTLQSKWQRALSLIGVKGSVMLAEEGINLSLAGKPHQVAALQRFLDDDPRFNGIWLKSTVSETIPYRRLRVRIRNEIIAFDGPRSEDRQARRPEAPCMTPETLKEWLSTGQPLTLLDTRNDYEIESGTFCTAINLGIKNFRDFKSAARTAMKSGRLQPDRPVVAFCTAGIRCEKAAPWLLEQGFATVFQLEGGVLNYFQRCGASHWRGDCFVFDERVELTPELVPTGAGLCDYCQLAVPAGEACDCRLGRH